MRGMNTDWHFRRHCSSMTIGLIAAALLAGGVARDAMATDDPPANLPEEQARIRPVAPPEGASPKRRLSNGEGGRRGADIPVERFIEVAEDIEPGWAKTLRERLETDREGTTKAIRQNGQRLVGLVMLKERNRGLYDMKVKELQAQIEARKIAGQYHEAKDSNRDEDCGRAMERMREICERIVNLQLWQRASELNSLEIFVKEQRESLERDARPDGMRTLVDQLMQEMTRARPAQGLLEIIERGGRDRPPMQAAADAPPPPPPSSSEGPPPPAPGRPGGPTNGRLEMAIDKFIAVARDVSPQAGDRLAAQLVEDREQTLRTIRQGGPRFFGLVVLKERDRDLYDKKVRELRKHVELRTAAQSYHDASADKRPADATRASDEMRRISVEIIDLQIEQRAHEVKSLSELLDSERAELAHDSQADQTKTRRDRLVAELMDAPPRPGLADLLERGGPRDPERPLRAPLTPNEVR
ncbi:MAG: hypothetical protein JNL80_13640 [Phycisphaerae bacterium]|nr:hypothetical protein [Phycisphaerae bacterium]